MNQGKGHYTIIKEVIEHIVKHKLYANSLEDIASSFNISSGHLQKVFTEWVGISPKQFSRYLSLQYSKELLKEQRNTLQTALKSGLSSTGRLYDLFVDIEAMTPGEYQEQGKNLTIHYSTFTTKFGLCLVASTERGICNVLFADTPKMAIGDLRSRWPQALIKERVEPAHTIIKDYFAGISPQSKIKFRVCGTNFQLKVWEALLSIPEGTLSTYGSIAERIGDRKYSRAVGAAVGDNPIGYIIPCHRVLRSTGEISGYHWGIDRKRVMLSYEAIQKHNSHS